MPNGFRSDSGLRRVFRRDQPTSLAKATRNAAGFLTAPASLAKVGPLEYVDEATGAKRIEIVLAEELFAPASMESFFAAPVVYRHPEERVVTADNAKKLSVGWPSNIARNDDGMHVDGTLTIIDGVTIEKVDGGENQLSPGYFCFQEPVPSGVFTMPDGTIIRADKTTGHDGGLFIQRERIHNHIAIEPVGRSGPTVSMRLDAAGDVIPASTTPDDRSISNMETITIAGVQYQVPPAVAAEFKRLMALGQAPAVDATTQAAQQQVAAANAQAQQAQQQVTAARTDAATAQGERDALKMKLAEAQARIDGIDAVEKDKAIAARAKTIALVTGENADDLAKAMKTDAAAALKGSVKKLAPEMNLDGKDAVYIGAVLDTLIAGSSDDGSPAARAAARIREGQRADGAQPNVDADPQVKSEKEFYGRWDKGAPKTAAH